MVYCHDFYLYLHTHTHTHTHVQLFIVLSTVLLTCLLGAPFLVEGFLTLTDLIGLRHLRETNTALFFMGMLLGVCACM